MMKFDSKFLRAYFVCGTQDIGDKDFPQLLETAIQSGITTFQYRDKGSSILTSAQRLDMGKRLLDICWSANIPFIVDDDVELANELHADGIHVGQKDERITKVIRDADPGMIIGLSCQTVAQVETANSISAIDYIGAGPIFSTNSKADAVPPMGLSLLQDMVQVSNVPIVAIGGITLNNLQSLQDNGSVGAAFITLITQTDNIQHSVQKVLNVFK
ncbi:thiamine phosphate synthase [Companilactobacillus mishanensis]